MESDLVLGIDGGGTKTVAWLAPRAEGDIVLGRGQSGPGNPRAAGFETALANIDAAIDAAFVSASLLRQTVAGACLCLAGAGRAVEQARITEWAGTRQLAHRVSVRGDAEPVLAAANAAHWGIALICGTGSLAWGRSQAGEIGRTGGWGYLIGDEGGAYAIAVTSCRAAVHAADGRGPMTELLPRLLDHFRVAEPTGLIEAIYHPEMTRERLAGLAVLVFETATTDAVAQHIVSAAADDLATMVAVLARRLKLPANGYPLALAGSVLLGQETFREQLRQRLLQRDAAPCDVHLVTDPVQGAVTLARWVVGSG